MRIWPFLFPFCLYTPWTWALTHQEVVRSSLKHFPEVIQAMQRVEQMRNEVRQARGAFDGKLKLENKKRQQGFYDGGVFSTAIEKPMAYLNSRIYGGERQSQGSFPSYEGEDLTLNGGEIFAGFSLSLLRNALIDENRYQLRNQQQLEIQSQEELRRRQIQVQTQALKAYWTWFVKGHELRVYQNILELANKRALQISKRIKAGDLAKIYEVENNQYIRKREAQLNQSEMEFQKASFYLSLFYRDQKGRPLLMDRTKVPKQKALPSPPQKKLKGLYSEALHQNIDLKILQSQREQAQLEVRLGTNELLPKVDVDFQWSQDRGMGPESLRQNESKVMVQMEVPLQWRKGAGKRDVGKAKLEQIKTKTQWVKDQLSVSIQSLVMQLNTLANIYQLTQDQVSLAQKLAQAERRKFSQGASDLILVNIREENMAEGPDPKPLFSFEILFYRL